MSKRSPNLHKAENPSSYANDANSGLLLGYPVKINGKDARDDNGIKFHSSIKYFDKDKDHAHDVHELAQHLPLNPPDAKNTQIEPGQFKDRMGNDVYVIKMKGNSADKMKEHNSKFAHMGFPSKFVWEPHVSVPKDLHDKIKASGAKTAHEAGIEFGPAELKHGQKTLRTYHHQADTTEPRVPDESDFTAKMNVPVTKAEEAPKSTPAPHEQTWFHGSPHHFEHENAKPGGGVLGQGHYLTRHKETANFYAQPRTLAAQQAMSPGSTGHVYSHKIDVRPHELLEGDAPSYRWVAAKHGIDPVKARKNIDSMGHKEPENNFNAWLQKLGYKGRSHGDQIAIFDKKHIKRIGAEKAVPESVTKSEPLKLKPLMKPYVSEAQRRWAHTSSGKEALGGEAGVHEWDEATKGKKLPEKVSKSEQSPTPKPNVQLNPEHGKTIANAYEGMKHDPNHPDVKAAYGALIGETGNQFKKLLGSGLKISQIKSGQANPYKSSKEMHQDVKNNKHLWYFPTEQGFGEGDQTPKDHPMLAPTTFKHGDKQLLANDVFRIVHDINGHHIGGESGFGPTGEHQAYLTHKKQYSPLAQKALASETMGQNNWVNFGPHGEQNRANPSNTKFAEQKAGLLPDNIINGKWHNEK